MHHAAHSLRRRLAGVALSTGLALTLAASFSASASARAGVSCSFATRSVGVISLRSFERGVSSARTAFFRTHRRALARRAFVKAQHARLATLKRGVARCSGSQNAFAEANPNPPPACSPSLLAAPYTDNNEGTTNSTLPLRPAAGRISAVMLFVDFPNLHASESASKLYDDLVPRAQAWYKEVSYGHVDLQVTPILHWYRLSHDSSDYSFGRLTFDAQRRFIQDAVSAADPEVDFSPYKVVYVVAAKGTSLQRSPAFHAYAGDGVHADGVELRYGATFGEDVRGDAIYASHVLAHETGHVFGLPDLYDVPNPVFWTLFRFAGGWDMMSWNDPGAHFFAWEKWKLGWLDSSQVTCLDGPGDVAATITPLERAGGLKAIVIPTGPTTAYVVEARRLIGADAVLCQAGVLVYSVDSTVRSGHGPIQVHPAQRDRSRDMLSRCGPLYNAPFSNARGEVARFHDDAAGITVQVVSSGPAGYLVRATRTSVVPQGSPAEAPQGPAGNEQSFAPPEESFFSAAGFPFGVGWDLNPDLLG